MDRTWGYTARRKLTSAWYWNVSAGASAGASVAVAAHTALCWKPADCCDGTIVDARSARIPALNGTPAGRCAAERATERRAVVRRGAEVGWAVAMLRPEQLAMACTFGWAVSSRDMLQKMS